MPKRSFSPVRLSPRERKTPAKKRVDALRDGIELQVTLGDVMDQEIGTVPGPEVRVVLGLARAIHRAESTDVSVSWEAQERARAYINEHGFAKASAEMVRLESGDQHWRSL